MSQFVVFAVRTLLPDLYFIYEDKEVCFWRKIAGAAGDLFLCFIHTIAYFYYII